MKPTFAVGDTVEVYLSTRSAWVRGTVRELGTAGWSGHVRVNDSDETFMAWVPVDGAIRPLADPETIATAAIRIDGEVWTLPRPARHDTPIKAWQWAHQREIGEHEHGFVTSHGRFVDRVEGARVAYAARQIPRDNGFLTSEDLW